ncbi:tetratricopeptide repeat-containing sensor histidine kinase [Fulvivirgaceae bacterium BMA12]|uniref:histidine kinase n=1 Tax=Agaribacillus aureus TaxID=3051825 RepID=A0ABT8LER5_9BACT|nr:tetratricopeptide repeat-containing sensor histidine kinase [Fulvivirgaceae bacterium BMA12]
MLVLVFCTGYTQAQETNIEHLVQDFQQATNDTARLEVMLKCIDYYYENNPDTALVIAYRSEKLAQKLQNEMFLAHAEREVARLLRRTGDYRNAMAYITRALAREKIIGNKNNISKAHNIIGVLYYEQSNFIDALKHYLHSLKIYEELENKDGIASIYNNLGLLYKEKGEFDQALEHYKKSLEINESLNDSIGLAYGYNNLGVIYRTKGNYKTSLEYFNKSLKIKEALDNKDGIVSSLLNLGITYNKQGLFNDAIEVVLKALKINKPLHNLARESKTYNILAEIYLKMGAYHKSVAYSKKAYEISKKIGNIKIVQEATEIQYKAYKQMGRHESALQFFEITQSLNDSLIQVQKIADLENLRENYEIEKQQIQIESLNKDRIIQQEQIQRQSMQRNVLVVVLTFLAIIASILYKNNRRKQKSNNILTQKHTEIELKNKELARLNQEIVNQNQSISIQKNNLEELNHIKNNLFTIVSHDFRSPLKSIQGFLNLLGMGALSQEETNKLVDDLRTKVEMTTDFLENLLTWARNQMYKIESKPQPVNLKKIAEDNVALLKPVADKKGVKLIIEIHDNFEAFADANMINLVIRNLVVNAIKFTSEGDHIKLSAMREGSKGVFSVVDNGIGIDERILSKLFDLETYSTTGTANEKGTGLGLVLCKDFVEKNRGTIWAESKLGEGSVFSFSIPLTPNSYEIPAKVTTS